jgi:hypothetical protein
MRMTTLTLPDRSEAAEYYFTYIEQAPHGVSIRQALENQLSETIAFLSDISDERSLHRYAPDKWSIREVVSHLSDAERLFTFRAMWFARGFDSPLPSFDQNVAIVGARGDQRHWKDLIDEFRTVRGASTSLFASMPDDAWDRRGIASGYSFTVRALAYITTGHVAHHVNILRDRYL